MMKHVVVTIAVITLPVAARAGAWVQEPGSGFYESSGRLVRATSFYEADGRRTDIPTVTEYTLSLYGEVGLSEAVTAVVNFPFFRRLTLNRQVGATTGFEFFEGDSNTGIGDLDVGLRWQLSEIGQTVLSAGFTVGVPTGDSKQESGLLTGDGELNGIASLLVGHSFYPLPLYATASVGYNARSSGFSHQVHYSVEAGYTFVESLTVAVRVNGVESLRSEMKDTDVMGDLTHGNNQRYLAFGPEISYAISETIGVSGSVEGATRARNVLAAPAFSLGVFARL